MSGLAWEMVDLIARWIHVIAATMWVGNSLLFNWLDRNLQTPGPRSTSGSVGEIWLLHSGAFYHVDKTLLGGQKMPTAVHWFFVQAFTTAASGLVLLIAVYWAGGRAAMTDSNSAGLSHLQAVLLGIGSIAAGNLVYQISNARLATRSPKLSAVVWLTALAVISVVLVRYLNGRAAFLHIGAMLGVIMATNVARTILPSQRALVASVETGASPEEVGRLSERAKRVSIHNNYFTFPVILLMLSNHFPSLYSSRYSLGLLLIIVAAGALIRHIMNVRFTWKPWKAALAATCAGGSALLYGVMLLGESPGLSLRPEPLRGASSEADTVVTFADVRHVIDRRCAVCHSRAPADLSYGVAPGGVVFDTPEQILARRSRILERAVITRTMPPGNKTGITEQERAVLGHLRDWR